MKKIVFVMPNICGGGAERVAAALVNEIQSMYGYEVSLVTYSREPSKEYNVDNSVSWYSMNGISRCALLRVWEKVKFFRETIAKIAPDYIISLGGPAIISVLTIAMKGSKIPVILSERNDPKRYPSRFVLRVLRQWAYRCCDAVVFQTREALEFFPAYIQRKGCVISNPITGNLPVRYTGKRDKRIVSCGRLEPQKNFKLLINAFSDISEEFPEYTLDIYGEGRERHNLEELIAMHGLEERVMLHGFSNQVYEHMVRAAVYVSSSDYEGISNSMLEALAMGVPTICTDCPAGGARETIMHEVNGLLVSVQDRKKLADAMKRVLTDVDFSMSISKEGSKIRNNLSCRAVAMQWLEFLTKME